MPSVHLANGTHLHYEISGQGPVLLAFAPGGLKSRSALWLRREDGRERGIIGPVEAFSRHFRVLTLDQRNAGQSRAPLNATDGWDAYADDHLLLLDALGIECCHVLGACIGPSFALKLIERAPDRVLSAVLQQPIGKSPDNAQLRREMFQTWAEGLEHPVDPPLLDAIEHNLFGGDFVYSVSRDFVRHCQTPLLVLPGDDARHPRAVAEEIAALAPNAQVFADWQSSAGKARYIEVLQRFFNAAGATP